MTETGPSLLEQSLSFAGKAHRGQCRRGGSIPYILHCTEAASIVSTMTTEDAVLAAAVLHDTLEDTATTEQDLRNAFGDRVADLVVAMSENKRPGQSPETTWLVRKEETLSTLAKSQDLSLKQLCLGDKLSNLRGISRDFRTLGDEVWERFHQKSPAKQGWYYRQLMASLSPLQDTEAWQEFQRLVQEVFGA